MKLMLTYAFWRDAVERAGKSFAQALLTMFIASDVASLFEIDVTASLGVAGLAAVVSVLTSIVSAPFGAEGTASVTK